MRERSIDVVRPERRLFLRMSLCWVLLTFGVDARASAVDNPIHVDQILNAPALKGGITGCIVERLDDKQVVYEHNADLRLMPASNRKLFTTAAVLGLLGPDYAISTPVLSASRPDTAGTIKGDIYLKGAGDSLLMIADLDDLAKSMMAAGIKKIDGGVVGDGSVFEDGPYGTNWGWDTLNDDYAPAITGLDIDDGIIDIDVNPGGSAGVPVAYEVDPPNHCQPIVDQAVTVDKGGQDTVKAEHPWRKDVIVLSGNMPLGGHRHIKIPVADPVLFAADLFRSALLKAGISVEGDASTGLTPAAASAVLGSHKSAPMSSYIASMNKPSDNLLAESLVRVIGIVKGGHGDYDTGDTAELAYFKSIGLDTNGMSLDDGSGVSRRDLVTARSVVDLLAFETAQPDFSSFRDSLPIAGVDGTLKHRLKGTPAEGNLRAKTGTLTGAAALSGYFTGKSGKVYAFSLLMNNYPTTATDVRTIQDQVVVDLVDGL